MCAFLRAMPYRTTSRRWSTIRRTSSPKGVTGGPWSRCCWRISLSLSDSPLERRIEASSIDVQGPNSWQLTNHCEFVEKRHRCVIRLKRLEGGLLRKDPEPGEDVRYSWQLLMPQGDGDGDGDGARAPSDREFARTDVMPMHGTQRVRPSGFR